MNEPPLRRRWFQFGLGTMFAAVTGAAIFVWVIREVGHLQGDAIIAASLTLVAVGLWLTTTPRREGDGWFHLFGWMLIVTAVFALFWNALPKVV